MQGVQKRQITIQKANRKILKRTEPTKTKGIVKNNPLPFSFLVQGDASTMLFLGRIGSTGWKHQLGEGHHRECSRELVTSLLGKACRIRVCSRCRSCGRIPNLWQWRSCTLGTSSKDGSSFGSLRRSGPRVWRTYTLNGTLFCKYRIQNNLLASSQILDILQRDTTSDWGCLLFEATAAFSKILV